MQRFLATACLMAVTCLMPVLALRAQEPSPNGRDQPAGGQIC